jgi:putative phosphoesterase
MPVAHAHLLPPDLPAERVVATIGLISDTHVPERCLALPPAVFTVLCGMDLVLHAGDVGELRVLDQLSPLAPVVAVHGNDETAEAQRELPYQQVIAVAGQRIMLTHAHNPDRDEELASRRSDAWEPILERRAAMGRRAGAGIVVFGHTHVPMARSYGDVFLINPGAIASANAVTCQRVQTVALLFLRDDGIPFVTHVDLAAPRQRFEPQIDWDAGFRAANDHFSASILAPDLAAEWERWQRLAELATEAHQAALLRVAHRCWSGEQVAITREDMLAELRADASIPAAVLAQFEAAVSHTR